MFYGESIIFELAKHFRKTLPKLNSYFGNIFVTINESGLKRLNLGEMKASVYPYPYRAH